MNCCSSEHTQAKDTFFTKRSKNYAKHFRKKGLDKPQQLLLEGILKVNSLSSKSLLEIGCGAGGMLISLLQRGASKAIGIDASEGMLEKAKEIVKEHNVESKIEFLYGDFSANANGIAQSDITILDKVLCCEENPQTLIEKSTAKTKEVYAVTFPKDSLLVRVFVKGGILLTKVFRMKFTPFYHEPKQLRSWIEAQNFSTAYANETIMWQVLVFKRK
jgi:SAM-dependent methyltransferase